MYIDLPLIAKPSFPFVNKSHTGGVCVVWSMRPKKKAGLDFSTLSPADRALKVLLFSKIAFWPGSDSVVLGWHVCVLSWRKSVGRCCNAKRQLHNCCLCSYLGTAVHSWKCSKLTREKQLPFLLVDPYDENRCFADSTALLCLYK